MTFEDQFRGTREDIKKRVEIYLPYIKESAAGTKEAPVLDAGCGRGEWLELLKENGYTAKGVDSNMAMVKQCKELELNVVLSDVSEYLRNQKPDSLGAITGFHIIEHLPLKTLIALFDESLRVLKPGGFAIFESPNPENLTVGACNFYTDPTHRSPLPSSLIKFLCESRGFSRVEIQFLHPGTEEFNLPDSESTSRLNKFFYGPQDYAVIGYKR